MKLKRKTLLELDHQVAIWNRHQPPGTDVVVLLDSGGFQDTKTTSEAWVMGGHSAMVKLEGFSGGYMLDRVKPMT